MLSILIISYNTRDLTLRCLQSVFACTDGFNLEVIVVDNASADGSPEAIAREFPQVKLIRNPRNAGFGAANNLAMAAASPQADYFLLLNSDAFLSPGSLTAMVNIMVTQPGVGLVGPRLEYAPGKLQQSVYYFPSPGRAWLESLWITAITPVRSGWDDLRHWPHDTDWLCPWVIGACMLVRRNVYEQIGGFDEAMFMYAEETDWQKRIAKAGWKIAFTPKALVTHLGGASSAGSKPKISQMALDSHNYFIRKHHGPAGLLSFRVANICGAVARILFWTLIRIAKPARQQQAVGKISLYKYIAHQQGRSLLCKTTRMAPVGPANTK